MKVEGTTIQVKSYKEYKKVLNMLEGFGSYPYVGNPCEGDACCYCKNNCAELNENCFIWKAEDEPKHKAGTCSDFDSFNIDIV